MQKKVPTIGIGYNMNRPMAPQQLAKFGLSYSLVLNGTQCLNDVQINKLFQSDLSYYESGVRMWAKNYYHKILCPVSLKFNKLLSSNIFDLNCKLFW